MTDEKPISARDASYAVGDANSEPDPATDDRPADSLGDERLQLLMKQALAADDEGSDVDVLGGVQQRLRDRSGGKFYRDGWSTSRHPPFATYFITSLMMLAIVAIIYAILTPLVGEPIAEDPNPKPVRILPPR
jgi:hypothetical protein